MKQRQGSSVRGVDYSSSPLLASPTPGWRSRMLVVLVGLGFAGLLGRAAYLQLYKADFLQQQGRFAAKLQTHAVRGAILDRNGEALAISVPASSLWVDPQVFEPSAEQRRELLKLLKLDGRELDRRIAQGKRFAWIARQVDDDLWVRVKALGIAGLSRDRENRRHYPQGETVAQLVGFTNLYEQGQEGMELQYQAQLQARRGSRDVMRDRMGRVIEDLALETPATDGADIQLSIDGAVQHFAYQAIKEAVQKHKAAAGSAVVLDTWTGEVLAMANYPSYNPDRPIAEQRKNLRNRAMTDVFEPGSTMKPFVVGLALETGRARPEDRYNVRPGSVVVTGIRIRDSHPYGDLTVREIVQKSSNIGTVQLAMRMQPRELWELFSSVGYGQRPEVEFPGAISGRLRPYKVWRPIEQATMAYGYGLSASLLQMARAYTAFARDGEVIPVTLIKRDQPVQGVRVFSPETAREIRHMLQAAAGPGGTGSAARTVGYSVGGKSGTAHKQVGKGYAGDKYRSWFVGLAPVERPRIVVAVMVDEPTVGGYYGGTVAAPVFSQVVQQTLRAMAVPPDIAVQPQVVASAIPDAPENF